jgi:hypothetical protein
MGYDVHITRGVDWTQNAGSEIPSEEWRARVAADPQLAPDPTNGPNAALWSAHPGGRTDAWLDWSQGNVYSTDPDSALMEKMHAIAVDLNALVQGDDGKVYATPAGPDC